MAQSRAAAKKLSANLKILFITGAMLAGAVALLQNKPMEMQVLRMTTPVRLGLMDIPSPPQPLFNPEAGMSAKDLMQRWEPIIGDAAKRFKIPAAWIRNVMRSESGGRTILNGQPIVSDKGALGLMQVVPGTYAEMAAQYQLGGDPFDPRDNIYAGAAYLRWLHGKYGFPAMFAAYNTGPGNLENHLHHGAPLAAETRAYVAGITRALGAGTQRLTLTKTLTLTAPDGHKIALDPAKIISVRSALPGEYASGVSSVIDLGTTHQGVRETPDSVAAALAPSRHNA
jgi:hypothetical protein